MVTLVSLILSKGFSRAEFCGRQIFQDHGKGGVELKGGSLHDGFGGFGGFDGFGGSAKHPCPPFAPPTKYGTKRQL